MTFDLLQADALEWLTSYDGPKYQAILSDPPYALISITKRFGKKDSAPAQEGNDGRFLRLSGGFMGQKWDGFDSLEHYQDWVSRWSKLLIEKALLPGAVCLFFGGTRTFLHLGVGLERGGFEIVDCLTWLYGAGFPKSHDIAINFEKTLCEYDKKRKIWFYIDDKAPMMTEPPFRHDEANAYYGYGTALKPAWEPIILCRAPRGSMTFAELAKTYGTGALNIDGSRIAGKWTSWRRSDGTISSKEGHASPNPMDRLGGKLEEKQRNPEHPQGRWPANLLLSHHEDCVLIGTFEVEGRTINRWKEGMKPFGDAAGEQFESEKLPPETVERWACVGDCAIRALDDQAGDSPGSFRTTRKVTHNTGLLGWRSGVDNEGYKDIGGPSRFFYSGKANRGEKDKGCEHFYWMRKDGEFTLISEEEWINLPRKERAKGNIHPTVKPLGLMRYLSTMILPPESDQERRLLVPFAGSGSEMIGAIQAGWEIVTGIEMEKNYIEIAQARYTGNLGFFSLK